MGDNDSILTTATSLHVTIERLEEHGYPVIYISTTEVEEVVVVVVRWWWWRRRRKVKVTVLFNTCFVQTSLRLEIGKRRRQCFDVLSSFSASLEGLENSPIPVP